MYALTTAIPEVSRNQEGFFRGEVGLHVGALMLLGWGDRRGSKGMLKAHRYRWGVVRGVGVVGRERVGEA